MRFQQSGDTVRIVGCSFTFGLQALPLRSVLLQQIAGQTLSQVQILGSPAVSCERSEFSMPQWDHTAASKSAGLGLLVRVFGPYALNPRGRCFHTLRTPPTEP